MIIHSQIKIIIMIIIGKRKERKIKTKDMQIKEGDRMKIEEINREDMKMREVDVNQKNKIGKDITNR